MTDTGRNGPTHIAGILAEAAERGIRRAADAAFPGKELTLLSSNLAVFGKSAGEPADCHAELLSEMGNGQQLWRATIESRDDAQSGADGTVIAEATNLYSLAEPTPESAGATDRKDKPVTVKSIDERLSDKRRQIFNGACTVIARHGFGRATIREIAKESGMSVPLLYKYIKDKDEILYLITYECMSDIISYFENELVSAGSPRQNIETAITKYIDYINVNRKYINLVYSETRALNKEARKKIFNLENAFLTFWRKILDDGVEKGVFDIEDTNLMANYIYFVCTVWSLRYWNLSSYESDMIKKTMVKFILSGIEK